LHSALAEFFIGNPEPTLKLFSRRENVTLGNPFGPFVRGWDQVSETATRAATHYRDGELAGFERVAFYEGGDLACLVEVERYRARIGDGTDMSPIVLRVSTVLRREDGEWRIASRHADPISAARPPESVAAG
jgi:ketosteroid isomerase-like protein